MRSLHGREAGEGIGVTDADDSAGGAKHAREPCAADVRVDQRTDGTELGDGSERGEEERAVQAQDRDRRSLHDPGATERARNAIHLLVVGAVGERLALERERDTIGNLRGLAAHQGTEGVGRCLELGEDAPEVHRRVLGRGLAGGKPEGRRRPPKAQNRQRSSHLPAPGGASFPDRDSPAFCPEISTLDDCLGVYLGTSIPGHVDSESRPYRHPRDSSRAGPPPRGAPAT